MSNAAIRSSRSCFKWRALAAFVIGLLTPLADVRGSTVEAMSLGKLADYAGQVIVGDVASVRCYWAENPRRIETEITFRNVSYLKGRSADASESFTLIVPGGTVGDMTLRVCCAPQFKAGTRRLLFLLPTYKTFPTVGLDQGAFEIVRDSNGVDRVHQSASQPVTGIDDEGFVQLGGSRRADPHQHLVEANGAVIHAVDRTSAGERAQGMTLAEFLEYVQPILDASRDYKLTHPAGRRELVEYRAVPLKEASGAAGQQQAAVDSNRGRSAVREEAASNAAPRINRVGSSPPQKKDETRTDSAKTGHAEKLPPSQDGEQSGGVR